MGLNCLFLIPLLRQIWRLPSLNSHSSSRRGATDPGPFSTARGLPADDFKPDTRVQSSHTKGEFWAIFGRTSSFYWFSLFLLPLSRFWPISFEPPLENPRLRPVGPVRLGSTSKALGRIFEAGLKGNCKKKFIMEVKTVTSNIWP